MSVMAVTDSRSNRAKALEAIERSRVLSTSERAPITPLAASAQSANAIASTTAAAVREALEAAVPYSSHGATLDAELNIQHEDASGGKTAAQIKLRYGAHR